MLKTNGKRNIRKTYTFTSTFGGNIYMGPRLDEVEPNEIIRNEQNGVKTVRNTFKMNFGPGFWKTSNKTYVNIIRNSNLYGASIFEIDDDGNDLTQKVIDDLEGVEEADVTPSASTNPYKLLPNTVLNKMSVSELQEACKSIGIETAEEDTKKDLVNKITK